MRIEQSTPSLRATRTFKLASYGLIALICGLSSGATAQSVEELTKLIASNSGSQDFMGGVLAMSGDTVVVGSGADFTSESVYVFVQDASGVWIEEAELQAADGVTGPSDSSKPNTVASTRYDSEVRLDEANEAARRRLVERQTVRLRALADEAERSGNPERARLMRARVSYLENVAQGSGSPEE